MVRSLFNRGKGKKNFHQKKMPNRQKPDDKISLKISKTLLVNLENVTNMLENPENLKIRELELSNAKLKCAIAYIDGLVDEESIQQNVLGSLQQRQDSDYPTNANSLLDFIYWKAIAANHVQKSETYEEMTNHLLSGFTILFFDGIATVLMIDTVGGDFRGIEEPVTETLIRGPRVGFIESIQRNVSMIRRNVKDPNLRFKVYHAGRRSKKSIIVTYIDGIINPELLEELDRRLNTIDMDILPESGYVEEWIEDSFLSPFPQMINTERPDQVINAIMQGKVGILIDGSPFALIAPINFSNVMQSLEDYYERWTIGSLLRLLRYLGAFISIFLPALYIALISLQPGMLPSQLVFSIAGTREGVPFPPIVEALLMVVTMELLQEAGARLPQTIGQTIGIVGGLVIGEAAVQAGVVSPIMVIVIALTAIANFAIPAYSVAIGFRIIRFAFMFAAGIFGLFGIILVYIIINIHFVNLKSFGVPYSAPFAPFFKDDWNDVLIRTPLQTNKKRPVYMEAEDEVSLDRKGENK